MIRPKKHKNLDLVQAEASTLNNQQAADLACNIKIQITFPTEIHVEFKMAVQDKLIFALRERCDESAKGIIDMIAENVRERLTLEVAGAGVIGL